jgi:NDP-sugar pyrophosphorylase family protein
MLKIVVPMSGDGRQFAENGFLFPKPLIEIAGRPMIEIVLRNIAPREPHEFIFVCRKEHIDRFALREVLQQLAPGCRIVSLAQPTAGALCSVLLAADQLGSDDDELLVANADQYVDASIDSFLAAARAHMADGSMMVFPSTHPKWSYARVEAGEVVEVAEKRPISPNATAGLYYFRSTRAFLQSAEQVILKNAAVSGQFYVCPVYNQYVLSGRRVTVYPMAREQMHSLGTPDDVRTFSATRAFALT